MKNVNAYFVYFISLLQSAYNASEIWYDANKISYTETILIY